MEPMQTPAELVASNGCCSPIVLMFAVLFFVVIVVSLWKVFEKAGQPGWAGIVPIYNLIVLLKIAGKPTWWFFLFLLPLINIFVIIVTTIGVARNFGKDIGFAAGLFFLPFIFYPVLAFGDATYKAVPT